MSILLIDIGNTRVKWARFDGQRLGRQQAAAFAEWKARDFAIEVMGARRGARTLRSQRSTAATSRGVQRIVVSSVAGGRVNRLLAAAARHAHGPKPEFVESQRRAGGVTTAYMEPWRLGVDRFAMAIGAHNLAKARAVCIISVGTALTIDLVDGKGRHRGGAILPAPHLMVESLLTRTNGIRRRASGSSSGSGPVAVPGAPNRGVNIFARTTRSAIEQGALLAAAAAVDRGAEEARQLLGRRPLLLLTGGGAEAVAPLVRSRFVSVPGLVLWGLAVLASEGKQLSGNS